MWKSSVIILVFLLAISACAAVTPRATETLTLRDGETAFVVENHNWNIARVYAGRQRLGLFGMADHVVIKRLPTTRVQIMVSFLASRDTWQSEAWDIDQYRCLRVRIMNYLALSYVVPC